MVDLLHRDGKVPVLKPKQNQQKMAPVPQVPWCSNAHESHVRTERSDTRLVGPDLKTVHEVYVKVQTLQDETSRLK